jgi:hypothetical protein
MTFTVLMFLIPRMASYRWPVTGGALLFSLISFFPGITAADISVNSQHKRFIAAAGRLDILGADGKPILEKLPRATEEHRQKDCGELYDAFDYICDHSDEKEVEARYGISDINVLREKIMPDNMPYGEVREQDDIVYLRDYYNRGSVDIGDYATMHFLREDSCENAYYYTSDSLDLTIYTPRGEELLREPLERILSTQLRKAGIDTVHMPTEEKLDEQFHKMTFYRTGELGLRIESMEIRIDTTLTLVELQAGELFMK